MYELWFCFCFSLHCVLFSFWYTHTHIYIQMLASQDTHLNSDMIYIFNSPFSWTILSLYVEQYTNISLYRAILSLKMHGMLNANADGDNPVIIPCKHAIHFPLIIGILWTINDTDHATDDTDKVHYISSRCWSSRIWKATDLSMDHIHTQNSPWVFLSSQKRQRRLPRKRTSMAPIISLHDLRRLGVLIPPNRLIKKQRGHRWRRIHHWGIQSGR